MENWNYRSIKVIGFRKEVKQHPFEELIPHFESLNIVVDSINHKPSEKLHSMICNLESYRLVVSSDVRNRLEFEFQPLKEFESPSGAPFTDEVLNEVLNFAFTFGFGQFDDFNRLALISSNVLEVPEISSMADKLIDKLPFMKDQLTEAMDFRLKINQPVQCSQEDFIERLNCISQWSAASYIMYTGVITPTLEQASNPFAQLQQGHVKHLLEVEVDLNTHQSHESIIAKHLLKPIFTQFATILKQTLAQGLKA